MKVHLLLPEGRAAPAEMPAMSRDALRRDLDLKTLASGIAGQDSVMCETLLSAMFAPLREPDLLRYRHEVLRDVLAFPEETERLYRVCLEADRMRAGTVDWMKNYDLSATYIGAVDYLLSFSVLLRRLRDLASELQPVFRSAGFMDLFRSLREELSDEYLESIRRELEGQQLADGVFFSARLNGSLQSVDYMMHRRERSLRVLKSQVYELSRKEDDDKDGTDLTKRQERALNRVTDALAQAAEYLASFFVQLRKELSFYIGGLCFTRQMRALGMPTCIPELTAADPDSRKWEKLYDVSLVYKNKASVVGNTLSAENKRLYIVTGANQGGKTTFLRSFGQAQMMAQCGLPVGAKQYAAPYRGSVFTHFRQEEDRYLKSGKLDKELEWMSRIADYVRPGDVVLFNESFASTNEREGSEIGREITETLIECGVEVVTVSHLHLFAASFHGREEVQFLRAERLKGGQRTFRLLPGEPEETAYGEDIYKRIFTEDQRDIRRSI